MNRLYPLCLEAPTKSPIWGGKRLLEGWNKTSEKPTVGESWELCVRKDAVCRVKNGALAGKTLAEVIETYDAEITGGDFGVADFPLLVKLIDAADDLSVQVHPDDAYAARVENDRGKTEMWLIVEADEDASIICGLKEGVTPAEYAEAVGKGDFLSALNRIPVKAGEVYFIPAGLPHAIGKGILIAEIQQNCDLTYRVFDYNRRQPDGSLRELHTKKALEVIRSFSKAEIEGIRYQNPVPAEKETVLADCSFFRVEKINLRPEPCILSWKSQMRHLLCLDGEGKMMYNGQCYPIVKGDSYLIPATLNDVSVCGNATLLVSMA